MMKGKPFGMAVLIGSMLLISNVIPAEEASTEEAETVSSEINQPAEVPDIFSSVKFEATRAEQEEDFARVMQTSIYPNGRLNEEVFPRQAENPEILTGDEIELPDAIERPLFAINHGKKFLIEIMGENMGEIREVLWFDYDLESGVAEEVNFQQDKYSEILSIVSAGENVYWVEQTYDYEIGTTTDYQFSGPSNIIWHMYCYSPGGSVEVIDSWENYETTAWAPILNAMDNTIVYQMGEFVQNENGEEEPVGHLFLLEKDNSRRHLFDVRNVGNSYMVPYIEHETIVFPEYYDNGWNAVAFNYRTDEYELYPMQLLGEHEAPETISMIGDWMLYTSQHGIFYATDINTGKMQVVDIGGGYKHGAVANGKAYYRTSRMSEKICSYDPEANVIQGLEIPAEDYLLMISDKSGIQDTLLLILEERENENYLRSRIVLYHK